VLPSVPTTAEAGFPGVLATSWYGFLAPKGVPDDVIRKLNAELRTALASTFVKERMAQQGTEPMDPSIDGAKALIADEIKRWRTVAEALGLQI